MDSSGRDSSGSPPKGRLVSRTKTSLKLKKDLSQSGKESWGKAKEIITSSAPTGRDIAEWAAKKRAQQNLIKIAKEDKSSKRSLDTKFPAPVCMEFGVCKYRVIQLSDSPLQKGGAGSLTFGELYRVLEKDASTRKIYIESTSFGNRRGWIDEKFHISLTLGEFKVLEQGGKSAVLAYILTSPLNC